MSPDEQLEFFNERAGILEHDAGIDRAEAERRAAQELETHRYRCEVRELLKNRAERGKTWLRRMFLLIEKARGPGSTEKLKSDVLEQWNKGNRGTHGVWL